jgi:hypothetical protein
MDYPSPQRDRANMSRGSATQRPNRRKALRQERNDPNASSPTDPATGDDANPTRASGH